MLSPLLCLGLLCPQGGLESAPQGLTVVVVDVGQGSSTVIRAPDGTVHVIDAGEEGKGFQVVNGVLASLQPTSWGHTFATHFHIDHIGGLDEVLQPQRPFVHCYDRGDTAAPSHSSFVGYVAAAGARRRTPSEGQVIQLGGGATATILALNGRVVGGTVVNLSGTAQEENSRSLAMRVDYGDFSMWVGGDLTGGGNGTADVESPASTQCGDVDVYLADHHGSNTSTNATLVNRLAPELSVFSAGSGNNFGHPQSNIINRLNQSAASTVLMGTSDGAGSIGFSVTGQLTIATDGTRYRATANNGEFLDFFVDEVTGVLPSPGGMRISELHRDPQSVPDSNGEYFELTNVGGRPVSLRGLRVSTNSGVYTIAADVMLVPGRPLSVMRDGYVGRNGGLPLGLVAPFNALVLGNGSDTLSLQSGVVPIDAVSYTTGFPGGSGVAAERLDLLGLSNAQNFGVAASTYGQGDRGTPGRRNSTDTSNFTARLVVDSVPGSLTFHGSALSHGGALDVLALAFTSTPGFNLFGTQVPLTLDPLLQLTFTLPGFVGRLPQEGYRSFHVDLPSPNSATGTPAFGAHVTLIPFPLSVPTVSPAVPFSFP